MAVRGVKVVAINTQPSYNLQYWKTFWKSLGAGDVLWAQDTDYRAIAAYNAVTLGTTIIIDRQGRIAYRDGGATSYDKLRAEVEKVL
jgi:hypothetical protein